MPRSKTFSPEAALDTLPELFLRRGYDALAIREIGDALGVSRSTVYGTFGTKPELFASVLHRYGPPRAPGLRELRDAPSPRAAPAIAAGAAQRCLVLDMIVKMPDSSPAVAGLVKAAVDDLQARFGAAIERGRAAGEIAAGVDPFQAAGALLGLYLGLYVLVHSGVASESVLAAVARQAQALLQGGRALLVGNLIGISLGIIANPGTTGVRTSSGRNSLRLEAQDSGVRTPRCQHCSTSVGA